MAFAQALLEPPGRPETGIVSIVSEQGYIAGLSSYRIDHSLTHGHSLTSDHFVAIDMFDRQAVVHALAEAIESLALEHRCGAIHTNLPEKNSARGGDDTTAALVQCGHHLESVRLCKILPLTVESKN